MTVRPPAGAADGPRSGRLAGIALMLGAVACFACLDASAKWVNRTTDPLLTAAVRYIGSFLVVGALLRPWARPAILRTRRPLLQAGRTLCLVLATVCTFYAVRHLPLTQMTSISFASPLVVALLAGPLLGERLDARRLGAVLAGFAGVLLVTRPAGADFHPAMLLALVTACASALYAVATRTLAGHDRSETTLFWSGLLGAAIFLPVLPLAWSAPASPWTWAGMAGIVAFGTLGHWMLILAHGRAPASVLAPFFYAQLLWATLLGFLVFGEVPDRWTFAGGAVVMASGLFLLHAERARGRAAAPDDAPPPGS